MAAKKSVDGREGINITPELRKLCTKIKTTMSTLARAEEEAKAKDMYERDNPETKRGGAPGKAGGGKLKTETPGYVRFLARETGWSARTITNDIRIVCQLVEEVKEGIRGTILANRTRDLLVLADLAEDHQVSAVEAFGNGGMKAMRSILAKVAPKAKKQPLRPMLIDLDLALGAVQVANDLRITAELISIDEGVAKVRLSRVAREDVQGETPTMPPIEAETSPEQAENESNHLAPNHPVIDLYALPGRPLTAGQKRGLLGVLADEDEVDALEAEAVELPRGVSPELAVYGEFAEAIPQLIGKKKSALKRTAVAVGMMPVDDENPDATHYIAYGDRGDGTALFVAVRGADSNGRVCRSHAVLTSADGKQFIARMTHHDDALRLLHLWQAAPNR